MRIIRAQYNKNGGIDAIIDDGKVSIPTVPGNRYYDEIMELVNEGKLTVRPAPSEPSVTAKDIKAEAQRRILALAPEHKQRNVIAAAVELLRIGEANWTVEQKAHADAAQAMWDQVRAIRQASNLMELYSPLPENYTDDIYWIGDTTFYLDLHNYGKALKRLEQYQLSVGQAEVTEEQGTGEFNADGTEIMETVVVQEYIAPLPAEVEETQYDENWNATIVMIPNPWIVKDDEERAAAQLIIDNTPLKVIDYYNANNV